MSPSELPSLTGGLNLGLPYLSLKLLLLTPHWLLLNSMKQQALVSHASQVVASHLVFAAGTGPNQPSLKGQNNPRRPLPPSPAFYDRK